MLLKKNETSITDKSLLWEHTKCQQKKETILYSMKRAKLQNETNSNLASKIKLMEKPLDPQTETQNPQYNEYLQTKGKWKKINQNKEKWNNPQI